ncbi:uncharacterized protein LOC125671262 isoform X2 [Ostrea edulis]|uniref:uncharacterized protein LOC125671262 isoform X2 n=1 Tax=Ostrea edulis TaxID=37623 RepID=UPI0024AEA19A|nr:uncharacterized protein LOC125671262 isoform X2 [Ostrea edulis]
MVPWKFVQLVLVLLPPRHGFAQSDDVTCYTYNYDKYLQCSWNSTTPANSADVTVKWSLIMGGAMIGRFDCPIPSQNSCTWDMEHGDVDPYCVIGVCVSLFNTCQEIHFKPAPVSNITTTNVTSTCVIFEWSQNRDHPKIHYPQQYHVMFLPLSDDDQEFSEDTFSRIVNDSKLDVCGLVPYTKYLIKITTIPLDGGIWSEAQTVTLKTKKAAPGLAPRTIGNLFSRIPHGNGEFSDVMLFWQELSKQRIYGSHLQYLVSICPLGKTQERRNCTEETESNSVWFQVPAQQEVTARIWSRNEIGISQNFAVIKIPSEDELIPFPDVMVVVSDTYTEMHWDVDPRQGFNVTVFWSHRDYKNLQWLEGVQNSTLKISHDHGIFYQYGVSVQRNNETSGIKWAECIFRKHELPTSPAVTLSHTKENQLMMTWNVPLCNMRLLSVAVNQYRLSVCSTSDCASKRILKIAPDVTSYIYLMNNEEPVCVQIEVVTVWGKSQMSDINCFRRERTSHLHLPAVSIVGVCVFIFIVIVLVKVIKWWTSSVEIQVPVIVSDQELLNGTPSSSSDCGDKTPLRKEGTNNSVEESVNLVTGKEDHLIQEGVNLVTGKEYHFIQEGVNLVTGKEDHLIQESVNLVTAKEDYLIQESVNLVTGKVDEAEEDLNIYGCAEYCDEYTILKGIETYNINEQCT